MVANLRVQLINKPVSPRTGIGRYATEIERGLRDAGATVRAVPLTKSVPQVVNQLAKRIGYDVDTFFESYPVRAQTRSGYVTHLTSQGLATLLLTQRLPRPVIVTVHDILPYLLRDDPKLTVYQHPVQRFVDGLAMRGLKRADRLIADSHYTKLTLVEALNIPEDRIAVVHLGVDTERFRPVTVPENFRVRHRLPSDRCYVLYVGSEDPRKNLPLLLRAFALFRQRTPNAMLLKVGAAGFSEQRAKHMHLCAELGITDAVRWFDTVSDDELPIFYNVADIFAFPSRYEGFGLPALEALACGTPVVALLSGPILELTSDAAFLVPRSDPEAFTARLFKALHQPESAQHHGIRWVRQFSWKTTVESTASLYETTSRERSAVAWTLPS